MLKEEAEPTSFEKGWPVMQMVLEDAAQKLTRLDILREWPIDYEKPCPSTLHLRLDRAVKEKLVERFGKGRPRKPFKFALLGRKFDPFGMTPFEPFNADD